MILVGPNYSTDMVTTIFFMCGAACPKAGRLDQDLRARLDKEVLVCGSFPILPYTERNVRADVLLLLSRENPYYFPIWSNDKWWRHLFTVLGRLPRIERTPMPKPGGFGSSRSKRVIAVHEQRARRLWISEYEKRQHKNVSVPEDVPLVGGPGEPAGTNGHAIIPGICSSHQMVNGEAQRALRRRIAIDRNVGCLPSCPPGITVLPDHACHVLDRALGVPASLVVRLGRIPRGMQGDDPIEPICFAHREFDVMPTVNQFNCARPMAGVIHDTTCHLHGNRDAVNCDLRYGTGQYAVDGQASAVVFRRDRYTLNQEMTIGQGGEFAAFAFA